MMLLVKREVLQGLTAGEGMGTATQECIYYITCPPFNRSEKKEKLAEIPL